MNIELLLQKFRSFTDPKERLNWFQNLPKEDGYDLIFKGLTGQELHELNQFARSLRPCQCTCHNLNTTYHKQLACKECECKTVWTAI